MTRETIAAALMVWLIGAIVGWCAGWAARGEQNRGWHSGVVRQLAQARIELAEALDQLDDARAAQWEAARVTPPAPAVVRVNVAAGLPSWVARHPTALATTPVVDGMPVLPADEGES